MTAPSIHLTFMSLAKVWAERSTCSSRIKVGAVLVDSSKRVIASGYNGAPAGFSHCDDAGCRMEDGHCTISIHAEVNAVIQCARSNISCLGTTMYSTYLPCPKCSLLLVQSGIHKIIYENEYGDVGEIIHLLDEANMRVWRYKNGTLLPIL